MPEARGKWDFAPIIWADLLQAIGNEYGVAGLMGNLEGESGCIPFRVQGDYSMDYIRSTEYTAKVDRGEIGENQFVNLGPGGGGYGLAQWTYPARKKNYWNWWKANGGSIGSEEIGVGFLLHELQTSFPSVWNVLKNARTIKEACDKVLYVYEAPANPDALEPSRLQFSNDFYKRFSGKPIPGDFDIILYNAAIKRRRRYLR